MKVTIIYDNDLYQKNLTADWGFSCLIEIEDTPLILFDTGANGSILLSNMQKLNIDPVFIEEVFISHSHWDHTGGLEDFLNVNPGVKIYIPSSCLTPLGASDVVRVTRPIKLHDNVYSTGELAGIEQSLIITLEGKAIVITGCSHPGVNEILKVASRFGKPYALIGGLHGFKELELLKGLSLICACHCTQYKTKIRSLYPTTSIDGGAGRVITI